MAADDSSPKATLAALLAHMSLTDNTGAPRSLRGKKVNLKKRILLFTGNFVH